MKNKDWIPSDWTLEQSQDNWSLIDQDGDIVLRGDTYENVRDQLKVFYKLGSRWAVQKMLEAFKNNEPYEG